MMDKIERIIDMTEHPERYSQDELQKMLIEDDEGSRIYKTISEVNAALGMEKDVKMKHASSKTASRFMQKVAAAIIGICLISGIAYAAVVIMKSPLHQRKARSWLLPHQKLSHPPLPTHQCQVRLPPLSRPTRMHLFLKLSLI